MPAPAFRSARCVNLALMIKNRQLSRDVHAKTRGRCWYCGFVLPVATSGWHIEHQIPASRGGTDDLSNLVPACARCNNRKKNKTVDEYRTFLQQRLEQLITLAYEHAAEMQAVSKFDFSAIFTNLSSCAELVPRIEVIFFGETLT